jgi:hypothetical protein
MFIMESFLTLVSVSAATENPRFWFGYVGSIRDLGFKRRRGAYFGSGNGMPYIDRNSVHGMR